MAIIFLFLLLFCINLCPAQGSFDYFPCSAHEYQIIHYENYSFAYSKEHEQAAWVAYELTRKK